MSLYINVSVKKIMIYSKTKSGVFPSFSLTPNHIFENSFKWGINLSRNLKKMDRTVQNEKSPIPLNKL
jgi:hypothetical protein